MNHKTSFLFFLIVGSQFCIEVGDRQVIKSIDFCGVRNLFAQNISDDFKLMKHQPVKLLAKEPKKHLNKVYGVVGSNGNLIQCPGSIAQFSGIQEERRKIPSLSTAPTVGTKRKHKVVACNETFIQIWIAIRNDLLGLEEMVHRKGKGHSLFSNRILPQIASLKGLEVLLRCRGMKTYADQPNFVERLLQKKGSSEGKIDQGLVRKLAEMIKLDQLAANAFPPKEFKYLSQKHWIKHKKQIFKKNQKVLEKILKERGFLGFNIVGKDGSKNFWLMVQHCDHDPAFQNQVLELMKLEVEKKNASGVHFAYLTDRVSLNTGKQQVYGTQVHYNHETAQAFPKNLADKENVNRRRKVIGLPPIESYLNQLSQLHYQMNREQYKKKGLKGPKLYKE